MIDGSALPFPVPFSLSLPPVPFFPSSLLPVPVPVPVLADFTLGDAVATAPFALLLLAVALLPLIPATHHWWESNANKLIVSVAAAAVTLAVIWLRGDEHLTVGTALGHALAGEYVPFIVLLFSLYTVGGGLRISGKILGRPAINTCILAVGTLAASFVGTTGASMLLIRFLLDINSTRRHVTHTVVFFIFLVSNIGGAILPIGDPPLFLGYLAGVPFLWTVGLWKPWLFCVGTLLAVYYVWDTIEFRREGHHKSWDRARKMGPIFVRGSLNIVWMALIVVVVATVDGGPHPGRPIPLLGLATPVYLRELLLLAVTAAAWATTAPKVREQNRFGFGPILEVAALFIGIFITMQPATHWLQEHGGELGVRTPTQFFWVTGLLSSVLDNAPTYLVFFRTAESLHTGGVSDLLSGPGGDILTAVSLGAVFMGANTYIGNGPNFMVKSIAESNKVRMPGFFGYMLYSGLVLLPLFGAVTAIFF